MRLGPSLRSIWPEAGMRDRVQTEPLIAADYWENRVLCVSAVIAVDLINPLRG